jgi:integrase
VLEGFKREQGVKPLKQATPLLVDVLKRLLGIYAKDTPAKVRDKALVLTGFASALRRSEIVALDIEDVESVPQGVVLRLLRSKTDQHGKGELIAIHRGTDSEFCAVTALERWIELRGPKPGPLFTRLHKGGRMSGEPMGGDPATLQPVLQHADTTERTLIQEVPNAHQISHRSWDQNRPALTGGLPERGHR